jgi:hypothetical protein
MWRRPTQTFVCLHRLHYEVAVPGCDCEHCWLQITSCTHPDQVTE